jgi:hypothetical protein
MNSARYGSLISDLTSGNSLAEAQFHQISVWQKDKFLKNNGKWSK